MSSNGLLAVLVNRFLGYYLTPRVQVPNIHILTPNLYYNYYYQYPKYLNIGYMDP